MYKTNQRTRIMDYLIANRERPVSVQDIRGHLEEEKVSANKTTIYRYLEQLETRGDVIRYAGDRGKMALFQYVDRDHHCDEHLHLKCVECGAVTHLDCGFMEEIAEHMEKDHGFAIQCRNSVIYGLCARCQSRHDHI